MPKLHHFAWYACTVLVMGCSRQPATTTAGASQAGLGPQQDWVGAVMDLPAPSAPGARYPHLAGGQDGVPVVMSWLEPVDNGFALRQARIEHGAWSAAAEVARGDDWFINWADFPAVVPLTATMWIAHWPQQRPDNVYSYDVRVAASLDGGKSWAAPYTSHDDQTATEHGFASITLADGKPYAVWLDGRNTSASGHEHEGHDASGGAMTLRGAKLGMTAAEAGEQIDARVCDCCQTDAVRSGDGVAVVYRDRAADETRNVSLVRLDAGHWSEPVTVHDDHWRIDACPVNGPAIDAQGDVIAVAWFTAPDQPRVRLAFSTDAGHSFESPVEVAIGKPIGRVDVVLLDDKHAVVSWMEGTPGGAELRAQRFSAKGPSGSVRTIARAGIARSSGFPQMVRAGDRLLFAWTESGATSQVRTAVAPLP